MEEIIHSQKRLESKLNKSYKKDFGIYLTYNIKTIDKILKIIDFEDKNLLSKKILEPSCGNGILIVRILEKLFQEIPDHKLAQKFIESCIYFVDINEGMIEETKSNISNLFKQTFRKSYLGKFNAFLYDYTLRIKTKYDKISLYGFLDSFDYIVGNPPYVTLYGRRDRKRNEAQRLYYLNAYSQFPNSLKNGKINYIMLFIEQSVDLLKDGGKLSFIVDLAFFETAYEHTRKFLLDNTKVLNIEYNIKDFPVASGQVILQVQKNRVKHNKVCIIDARNQSKIMVDQANWYKTEDQYRFRFNTCLEHSTILNKIKSKNCPSLISLFPKKNLRTCTMLLNMENLFVFDKPNEKFIGKIYPYYQGSKSLNGKYQKLQYHNFFHYDKVLQYKINSKLQEELSIRGIKNKKRIGFGDTNVYDNPKVYIRQSAKEIIASFDNMPSAANNSLYAFSLRDSSKESIEFLNFLCGILNSKLMTFYAQQTNIIRYSKGKQPQMKISDLYLIPIPQDIVLQKRIIEIVKKIYQKQEKLVGFANQIDRIIYEYYNLTEDEVSVIVGAIQSF